MTLSAPFAPPSAPPATPGTAERWGEAVRDRWALEPGLRFLNHGAFGATPIALSARQAEWRARIERNPVRFFMAELPALLREAAAPAAGFLGTAPERLGFVSNATAGVNTVLRSLAFAPGDEILTTDHVYNAVRNALRHVAARAGARVIEAPVGMPVRNDAQISDAIAASINKRTRLVVVDHVASASAVTFPVAAIAALCRGRGIPVLVDGAHAPGLLDLDVDAIDADWYVGNAHKWLCGPKSAAFLAVANRAVPEVHPLAISHAYGQGFTAEFDKIGTHDPSAALTVPDAIAFHAELGAASLRQRNAALALQAGQDVAAALGTQLGATADLFQAMVTVRLPAAVPATREALGALHDQLWEQHRVEAAFTAVADQAFLRLSAQAYNTAADYQDLGPMIRQAITGLEGRAWR